jgi:hypothetical protein
MRVPLPLVAWLLVAVAGASCASSPERLYDADRRFEDREFGRALAGYREVAERECAVGADAALCCDALRGQAESLRELQEAQESLRVLRRARGQCPFDLQVRRRLYEAEHPQIETDTPPAASSVTFSLEMHFGTLGERAKVVWAGLFFDGQLATREPVAARPGQHEVETEIYLDVPGGGGDRGPRRLRLAASKTVTVPSGGSTTAVTGKVTLRLEERRASLPEERFTLTLEGGELVPGVAGSTPPPPKPNAGPLDRILAEHLGISMRTSGGRPKVPRELLRAGQGWKIPTELCVSPQGRVEMLRILAPAPAREPRVDASIFDTIRRWRYGQYILNGVPQPFCHALLVDLGGRDPS